MGVYYRGFPYSYFNGTSHGGSLLSHLGSGRWALAEQSGVRGTGQSVNEGCATPSAEGGEASHPRLTWEVTPLAVGLEPSHTHGFEPVHDAGAHGCVWFSRGLL